MMTLGWYDWAGFVGVVLVLLAFFLLQAHKFNGHGITYQLMNGLGSIGIMLSLLLGTFNWPAFLLEVAWLLISLFGIVTSHRRRVAGKTRALDSGP